jgi:penicillin-binding protein 1A
MLNESIKQILIRAVLAFLLLFLSLCGVTLGVIYNASRDLPNIDVLNRFQPYLATEIYADNGQLIGEVDTQNRLPLSWSDVPNALKQAIVAVEDSRFYSHHGVDVIGIARAFLADIRGEGAIEGASTITQQLARNLFLTPQVSLTRKIKEALLALEIERRFSKDEILLMYLNQVYFGAGAYGAQAAAETYFGKRCKDLDLAECALLAGLPQAPSAYDPFADFQKAKARQLEVLNRMVAMGDITQQQVQQAYEEPLHLVKPGKSYQGLQYPYFTTYVVHKLLEKFPADLVYRGGLQVYTTLDIRDQKIAQEALRKMLDLGKREHMHVSQGALVAIQPSTGYIRAMVGGYKFSIDDQFNRAWQALRQPGSAFKIFDYTAAVDSGIKPTDVILDEPVCYPSGTGLWCPKEWDGKYWGKISVLDGLTWSRNTATVRMVAQLGIDKVIDYAHRMGIVSPLDPYLPTALGASVVTPLEMCDALCTLANEGLRVKPSPFKIIKDQYGNVLLDNTHPEQIPVLSPQTASTMIGMMENVINHGTGTAAKIGRPAAGKTGTTSDFRDAWFAGFTPDLACVVWNGNDDNSPMANGAYGGFLPAKTWAYFMKQALKGVPHHTFPNVNEPILQPPKPKPLVKNSQPPLAEKNTSRKVEAEKVSAPDISSPVLPPPSPSTSSSQPKPTPSPSPTVSPTKPTPSPSPTPLPSPSIVKKI